MVDDEVEVSFRSGLLCDLVDEEGDVEVGPSTVRVMVLVLVVVGTSNVEELFVIVFVVVVILVLEDIRHVQAEDTEEGSSSHSVM